MISRVSLVRIQLSPLRALRALSVFSGEIAQLVEQRKDVYSVVLVLGFFQHIKLLWKKENESRRF